MANGAAIVSTSPMPPPSCERLPITANSSDGRDVERDGDGDDLPALIHGTARYLHS